MNWQKYHPPAEAAEILTACPSLTIAQSIAELVDLACGGARSGRFEVAYEVAEKGRVVEATVARVRNGVAANYPEPYMRRRDPDCMVIGDDRPSDEQGFRERFGGEFAPLRAETFAWLKTQPLAMFGFVAGQKCMGLDALVIAPANAGFFALGLALLQGIVAEDELPADFDPKARVVRRSPGQRFERRRARYAGRVRLRREPTRARTPAALGAQRRRQPQLSSTGERHARPEPRATWHHLPGGEQRRSFNRKLDRYRRQDTGHRERRD